ncbi:MAG: NAD(P)H-quinone oxidoreductase [Gemmatimonadota bacterium]
MRAIVISRPGGPEVLEIREVPRPVAGPGEILVRVRAAGLNRADVLQRKGQYPAPAGVPADIPGLEYAGTVAELGPAVPGAETPAVSAHAPAVGQRVMGLVAGGAYAEYLVTPAETAIAVPGAWGWAEAAAVPEAFLTAYDALVRQMRLAAGESVLIHAVSSGVGTAAVQIAKAWGARTLGTSRSADKLARAMPLGLDVAIDTSREDFAEVVRRETDGCGVDVVLDLVGGPALDGNLRALATRGRMIVVGLTAGRSAPLDLGLVLTKRLTIVGTALRSRSPDEKAALTRDFAHEVLPLFAAGRLRPVLDRTFPMAEVAEAHGVMEASAHFGKLVLVW